MKAVLALSGWVANLPNGPLRPESLPYTLMIHLCTAAKLQKSPEVEISHSMSAFMQGLGMAVTGGKRGSIGRFKEQLNRLAAPRIQLLFQDADKVSMRNSESPISRYDVWFTNSA
jgi:hypothetical protein